MPVWFRTLSWALQSSRPRPKSRELVTFTRYLRMNRLLKYADDSYLPIGSRNNATDQHVIQIIRLYTYWAKSKNLLINANKTRKMAIIRKNKASLATQPSVA